MRSKYVSTWAVDSQLWSVTPALWSCFHQPCRQCVSICSGDSARGLGWRSSFRPRCLSATTGASVATGFCHRAAACDKSSVGWFYSFKLHPIVNDRTELPTVQCTPGNIDDRRPVPQMSKNLWGKLVGDRAYLSQALFEQLFARGLQSVILIRKNMQKRLVVLEDKLLTRKRFAIETIFDRFMSVLQFERTRHRSTRNLVINLVAGLIAYTWQPLKPSLHLPDRNLARLLTII